MTPKKAPGGIVIRPSAKRYNSVLVVVVVIYSSYDLKHKCFYNENRLHVNIDC